MVIFSKRLKDNGNANAEIKTFSLVKNEELKWLTINLNKLFTEIFTTFINSL